MPMGILSMSCFVFLSGSSGKKRGRTELLRTLSALFFFCMKRGTSGGRLACSVETDGSCGPEHGAVQTSDDRNGELFFSEAQQKNRSQHEGIAEQFA